MGRWYLQCGIARTQFPLDHLLIDIHPQDSKEGIMVHRVRRSGLTRAMAVDALCCFAIAFGLTGCTGSKWVYLDSDQDYCHGQVRSGCYPKRAQAHYAYYLMSLAEQDELRSRIDAIQDFEATKYGPDRIAKAKAQAYSGPFTYWLNPEEIRRLSNCLDTQAVEVCHDKVFAERVRN